MIEKDPWNLQLAEDQLTYDFRVVGLEISAMEINLFSTVQGPVSLIHLGGETIKLVDQFKYLGFTVQLHGQERDEITILVDDW